MAIGRKGILLVVSSMTGTARSLPAAQLGKRVSLRTISFAGSPFGEGPGLGQ